MRDRAEHVMRADEEDRALCGAFGLHLGRFTCTRCEAIAQRRVEPPGPRVAAGLRWLAEVAPTEGELFQGLTASQQKAVLAAIEWVAALEPKP